jgi:tRNA dimethylallyltransferase
MTTRVVAIYGPTASGKSAAAIALAHLIGGEVVSADSMQIYRGLERITNQPTATEQQGVPHHLLGHVDPHEPYDVVQYATDAHAAIDEILARDATPIVAGGSGLYLRAALAELAFPPQAAQAARERIRVQVQDLGPDRAHAHLAAIDPVAAARIAPADTRRIVRALELAELGESLAPETDDALWTDSVRHPTRLFGLHIDRALVHARIDARTPHLLEGGGIDEINALLSDPRPLSHTAARAHGLDDVRALREGSIDRAECERRLSTRTRQYAKRQDTWLRRLRSAEPIDANRDPERIAAEIAERLQA